MRVRTRSLYWQARSSRLLVAGPTLFPLKIPTFGSSMRSGSIDTGRRCRFSRVVGGRQAVLYSETMRRVLLSEGIPPAMIWTESESTNTHENAVNGSEILRAHNVSRIVLVVEANGMLRATQSFSKAGISVIPSPVRYTQLSRDLTDFLPGWRPIQSNGDTIHELVGIIWYKSRGWI